MRCCESGLLHCITLHYIVLYSVAVCTNHTTQFVRVRSCKANDLFLGNLASWLLASDDRNVTPRLVSFLLFSPASLNWYFCCIALVDLEGPVDAANESKAAEDADRTAKEGEAEGDHSHVGDVDDHR